MLPNPDVMTARPFKSQPPNSANGKPYIAASDRTPVSALKELVACLHREQHKIQDLLSSLGFALRSFNNLNQFLELIPLMSARVTDTEGGALVLLKPNGKIRLEQIHCQDNQGCQILRQALEQASQAIAAQGNEDGKVTMSPEQLDAIWASFDDQVNRDLDTDIRLFGTPILIKNVERGRLYVFTDDLNYNWTPTRQKLVRLVADQTAVAIANDELTVELRKKERLDRELEIGAEIQL
ncbi:MAG: guanylate cyclase, partial [Coleofasciculus sp. C2-GNP5-27]